MHNFTVGPVQMDEETRMLAKEQIPYFRTPEFSALMKENERVMCELFDAPSDSRVVFMTGSGTASMEGAVMNFFTKDDRVLVVNGGSFGHRLVEFCGIYGRKFTLIMAGHLQKQNSLNMRAVAFQECFSSSAKPQRA